MGLPPRYDRRVDADRRLCRVWPDLVESACFVSASLASLAVRRRCVFNSKVALSLSMIDLTVLVVRSAFASEREGLKNRSCGMGFMMASPKSVTRRGETRFKPSDTHLRPRAWRPPPSGRLEVRRSALARALIPDDVETELLAFHDAGQSSAFDG